MSLKQDLMDDFKMINVSEYLEGRFELYTEDRCEQLEPEPDEGNMEYKLKLVNPTPERIEHLVTQMNYRLNEGNGEAIYRIGVDDDGTPTGLSDFELRASIQTLYTMATELQANITILRVAIGKEGKMAQLLVRRKFAELMDVRVCIVGDVEAGKSTLVGVLTSGELDDGDGAARMGVFRHRHEIMEGRTSSISQQILGFDSSGSITNYGEFQDSAWAQIVNDSAKVLTLIDLAGHERFLKTTVLGLTGQIPDYAAVVVAADTGVLRMTRQHLGVCFALNIPVFVIVTKTDVCTPEVLQSTMDQLTSIIHSEEIRKLPVHVKLEKEVVSCARHLKDRLTTPIFQCSCVTGAGLTLVKSFLRQLPKHKDWTKSAKYAPLFAIDQSFSVLGVGTVVSGLLRKGTVEIGDTLLFGPSDTGQFSKVTVKSIQIKRNPVRKAVAGQAATFAFKRRIKRSTIRKGMVLVHPARKPAATRKFKASVLVLNHLSGIKVGHQLVVHVGNVAQAAKVVMVEPPPANGTSVFCRPRDVPSDDLQPLSLGRQRSRSTGNLLELARSPANGAVPDSKTSNRTTSSSDLHQDHWRSQTPSLVPKGSPPALSSMPDLQLTDSPRQFTSIAETNDEKGRDPSSVDADDGNSARLKTGDRAIVTFEFVHRPEYLEIGSKMIFREATTKGIGRVLHRLS